MILKTEEIEDFFTDAEMRRAFGYYKNNKVRSMEIYKSRSGLRINSTVKGTYPYSQDITLKRLKHDIDIVGECSCPVGYNCKHVATVLIKYIKEFNKAGLDNEWLREVEVALQDKKVVSDYVESEIFLTYRLFEKSGTYANDLIVYKSKILKNGSIGKGIIISSMDNLLYHYNHDDIKSKEDIEVMAILKSFVPKYSYNEIKIKGKMGYNLLEALVDTKRVFFKDKKRALSFSKDIIYLNLKWRKYKDKYKLIPDIDTTYYIVYTIPLVAINTVEQKIVKVNTIYSNAFLGLIAKMPYFGRDELPQLFFRLHNLVKIPIPIPEGVINHKIRQKPMAEVNLVNNIKPEIELFFKYQDIKIAPTNEHKESIVLENEEVFTIYRDLEAENSAKEYLLNLGFIGQIEDNKLKFITKDGSQDSLLTWENFLKKEIAELQNRDWIINKSTDFNLNFKELDTILVESKEEEEDGWFSLSFDIKVEEKTYSLVPLISHIIEEFEEQNLPPFVNIEIEPNSFVKVPLRVIEPILKTLYELFDKIEDNELKISKYDAHLIANIDEGVEFKGKKELLELSKKLKNFKGIKKVKAPKGLKATLRAYQQEGLNWLNFLQEFGFGGILADDMGLGKTIQTLALISYLKESKKITKPVLIVMPTSLIFNWKDEIEKFTPKLNYTVLHGVNRGEHFNKLDKSDIILTTYQLVARDIDILKTKEFSYVILDESQKIKNPKTKMARAVKELKTEYKLALSGTPIENNLEELWSIFSFLMPGFLGDLKFFKNYYQKEIEKNNSIKRMEQLRKKITPFIIRRTKEKVAKELPQKTEIIKYAEFENAQARLYESIRVAMEKKVKEAITKKGLSRSHITILDALLKLRQVCCDPSLLKLNEAKKVKKSAKFELLFELIDKLIQENKKILLFSQFTSMLDIIEQELKSKDIKYTKLTGSTRKREEVIKEFKKEQTKIFLISLKAGGVGLNLTEADTIIHYDPWWNPAAENQATDRAYRIGQDKKVFVYKLIVKNSIEQKILELQKRKAKLQESIYESKERTKIDGSELLELLKS